MFCPATGAVPALRAANMFWVKGSLLLYKRVWTSTPGAMVTMRMEFPQLHFRNRLTHGIYISPDPISAGTSLSMLAMFLLVTEEVHVKAAGTIR